MFNHTKKILSVILCLILCVLVVSACAQTYSNVYGRALTRVRVRDDASTSSTVFDNIEQNGVVYITESKETNGTVFLHIKYHTLEGKTESGWVAQSSGGSTYVEILDAKDVKSEYDVSGGTLPKGPAGTKSASEREELRVQGVVSSPAPASSSSASTSKYSASQISDVQQKLGALGIYSGEITGKAGEKTIAAIQSFQKKIGLEPSGNLTPTTLSRLDEAYSQLSGAKTATAETKSANSASSATIMDVQEKLKELGLYQGEITGNAGDKTTAAIKEFQKENGLAADGIVGSATLSKLNAVYNAHVSASSTTAPSASAAPASPSVSSSTISDAQEKLKALGMYSGEITGNAGSKTEAAIKAFQKKYGLTADGILGSATLSKLNEVYSGTQRRTIPHQQRLSLSQAVPLSRFRKSSRRSECIMVKSPAMLAAKPRRPSRHSRKSTVSPLTALPEVRRCQS